MRRMGIGVCDILCLYDGYMGLSVIWYHKKGRGIWGVTGKV